MTPRKQRRGTTDLETTTSELRAWASGRGISAVAVGKEAA
ncbi:MAG: hypothetical protein JWM74_3006 [Myxococcaceae bacterium]|jgi:hypothetical protein|nr:hypothetical protein [Myxococcaceae bacterium]